MIQFDFGLCFVIKLFQKNNLEENNIYFLLIIHLKSCLKNEYVFKFRWR